MHQQYQPFHTRNFFYALLLAVIYLAYWLIKPYAVVLIDVIILGVLWLGPRIALWSAP